jgi:formamidopyrimidine-DNA glycosylase
MPELPEVENRLRYLQRTALGQVIKDVHVSEARILKCCGERAFKSALRGRRLAAASRRGKYLIVTLDNGRALILHFTMGGDLKYYQDPADKPRFTRIEFLLDNSMRLAFTCPRNICRVMIVDSPADLPALREMGPEPLADDFTLSRLRQIVGAAKSRQIKALLMDQGSIAGIGNIYADEILFQARIRPDRPAPELTEAELRSLHKSIRKVLGRAILTGADEEFPATFLIARDARGQGCARCKDSIQKTRIAGRTTRFCAECQQ